MNVYVVTVDWKDRMFEPELVGVFANEDKAREVQCNKILELQEQIDFQLIIQANQFG